jgi:hypothetical protein
MFSRLLLVLSTALAAFAQSDRGTITGTVSDPAKAVIANATVEAKNDATGTVFSGRHFHHWQLHARAVTHRNL